MHAELSLYVLHADRLQPGRAEAATRASCARNCSWFLRGPPGLSALLAAALLLGACQRPAPAPGPDLAAQVARLQKDALATPPPPAAAGEERCLPVAAAAEAHLARLGAAATRAAGSCRLDLPAGEQSPLNRFAAQLAATTGAHAAYDLRYFWLHPRATAAYDPATHTLILSHEAILSGEATDANVAHQRVRAASWSALRAGRFSPYQGQLSGAPFQPEPLDLGELEAYAAELTRAVDELVTPAAPPAELASADLAGLLARRQAGGRPAKALTGLAQRWDRVAAVVALSGYHAFPAVEALSALATAREQTGAVRVITEHGATFAVAGAELQTPGGPSPFEGRLAIPPGTPEDAAGGAFDLRLASARSTAEVHATHVRALEEALVTIAGAADPGQRAALLRALPVIAGSPWADGALDPRSHAELVDAFLAASLVAAPAPAD